MKQGAKRSNGSWEKGREQRKTAMAIDAEKPGMARSVLIGNGNSISTQSCMKPTPSYIQMQPSQS